MKHYFKNLTNALLGRNPYSNELTEVRERYDQAAENLRALQDMYYNALEKWTAADSQVKSLQKLTENLRERIGEKDALIERIKEEYRNLKHNKDNVASK